MARSNRSYMDAIPEGLSCLCWDHLRAVGVTPDSVNASKHRQFPHGHVMRTDNGQKDGQAMQAEQEARARDKAKREGKA